MRRRIKKAARKNLETADEVWQSVMRMRSILEEHGAEPAHLEVLNVLQFALMVNSDLICLFEDLLRPKSNWHRNLHTRLLALILVEYTDDLAELLGRSFRTSVSALDRDASAASRLNQIMSKLHSFQRTHAGPLRLLRNQTIGHREHDARTQFEWISSLDYATILQLGIELTDWTSGLYHYLNPLLIKLFLAAVTEPQESELVQEPP